MAKLDGTLTQAELKQALEYDPETGVFRWRWRPGIANSVNCKMAGKIAGNACDKGYVRIKINDRFYKASRLAWLYIYGEWPSGFVDHANRVVDKNVPDNLRDATRSQNKANAKLHSNNKSGFKGVYWRKDVRRYVVQIRKDRKISHRGFYDCVAAAWIAAQLAAIELHGEFARVA